MFTPVLANTAGQVNESSDDNPTLTASGDTWYIDDTIYLNGTQKKSDFTKDRNIMINSTGKLMVNNATLTLLIDGYHPWKITVRNGGMLNLWNSTVRTQTNTTLLRPFVKTNLTAKGGSYIDLNHNSTLSFPGWVYIDNSYLNMQDSKFTPLDNLPEADYNWDGNVDWNGGLDEDDNDDCPRLIADNNSDVYMEDSRIENYYENDDLGEMMWEPYSKGALDDTGVSLSNLSDDDNEYYEIEPTETMMIESWNLTNSNFPVKGTYPYLNPFDRITSLYVEVIYKTEEDYTAYDSLNYSNTTSVNELTSITNTDAETGVVKDIWEIGMSNFGVEPGEENVMNLTFYLNNTDPGPNATIQIDEMNLISAYDNDINIWNSEMTVINSYLDIDFNASDTDPRDASTEATDEQTWLEDSRTRHSVLRLYHSNFKGYGLSVTGEPSAQGDPVLVQDRASDNKIYRWTNVRTVDKTGTPLEGAEIKALPNNNITSLDKRVAGYIDPYNNTMAWDYLNRTDWTRGYFNPANESYVTDEDGLTTMFLLSDLIKHPRDWPNSKFVGSYTLNGTYSSSEHDVDLNYTDKDTSISAFPDLSDSANNCTRKLEFDLRVPNPDLVIDSINAPDEVLNGDQVTVSADIVNPGGTDAHNVTVELSYNYSAESTPQLIGSDYLGTVPGNASTTITTQEFDFNYPEAADYEIIAEVDTDNNVSEEDETNNVATKILSVKTAPDLIPTNFTASPDPVTESKYLDIISQVKNQGGWPTDPVTVTFRIDGTDVYSESISGLAPGEVSNEVSYSWEAEMQTDSLNEDRTVEVIVEGDTNETATANNGDSKTVTIVKAPDLSITKENITFNPSRHIQNDTDVQVTAIVSNSGGGTVTTDVTFYDGMALSSNMIDEEQVTIPSQDTAAAQVTWHPTRIGYHDITVVVDRNDEVFESDETNNQATSKQPIFNENYLGDIIVNGTETVDMGGQTVNGFIVVEDQGTLNIGNTEETSNLEMQMNRDNQFGIIVRDEGTLNLKNTLVYSSRPFSIRVSHSAELKTNYETTIYSMVTTYSRDNAHLWYNDSTLEGGIDITGGTLTARESEFTYNDNHIRPDTIDCINTTFEDPLTDLYDTTGTLTGVETDSIHMRGDSTIEIYRWIEVTALSNGSIPIQNTAVTAESTSATISYQETGTTKEGGVVYLSVLTGILTSQGSDRFASEYEMTAEYTESGNTYTADPVRKQVPNYPSTETMVSLDLMFDDLKIPDLWITDDQVQANLTELTVGDSVQISATIGNDGRADAQEVGVSFYMVSGGNQTLIGNETLNLVPSRENRTASIDWTPEKLMDETKDREKRKINVVVDQDVLPLDDANGGNNEASFSLVIKAKPLLNFTSDLKLSVGNDAVDDTVIERDNLGIMVELMNSGGTNITNATIKFKYDGGLIGKNIADLLIDEEVNVTQQWMVDIRGSQTITVWVNTSAVDNISISKDITIEDMGLSFTGLSLPSGEQEGGNTVLVTGELVRSQDDKPIEGITVNAYIVDENGNVVNQESPGSAETNADGEFTITMVVPDEAGDYRIRLVPDHPAGQEYTSDQEMTISPAGGGIPLWMIFLFIAIAAAGVVGGAMAYLWYRGPEEWVECGNCGATISAEETECPECGVEFEMDKVRCSECGDWIPASASTCPECGAEFITTGKEIEEYSDRMRDQYKKYKQRFKKEAEKELGRELSDDQFMKWWKNQPSFITFDEWVEREEIRRKEGGIECPECGSLNPSDAAICQKCGSTLIHVETEEEEGELTPLEPEEKKEKPAAEPEEEKETTEKTTEKPKKKKVKKKVKKKPKKVKKKVKKKGEEEEES